MFAMFFEKFRQYQSMPCKNI